MFEKIKQIIAQADAQGRFLNKAELEQSTLQSQKAQASLEAAQILSQKSQGLAAAAAQAVYGKFPYTTQASGSQYASTPQKQVTCIRDIEYYIRMLTYCLVAGSTQPLDEYLLSGLKEINAAFGLSSDWYIQALAYIKANHGVTGQAAEDLNSYIDYAINALS